VTLFDRHHLTAFRAACRVNPFTCTFADGKAMLGMKTGRKPVATQAQPNTGDRVPEVITLALEDLPAVPPMQGDTLETETEAYRIAAFSVKGPLIHFEVDPAVALP
jgi:hypothetical protein